MKNIILVFLFSIMAIFTGCSTTSSNPEANFLGKIGDDFISGETQIDDTGPNSLLIRGHEDGDIMNGKMFTIILDDFKGQGSYKTRQYSYAQLIGGDSVIPIAQAKNLVGNIKVDKVNGEFISGKFSGNLIVQETGNEISSEIIFKVKKITTSQN